MTPAQWGPVAWGASREGWLQSRAAGWVWAQCLRLILHAVDGVGGALRPAVPRQDVFEVAGLEFHVLKKIRGVLSNVGCERVGAG